MASGPDATNRDQVPITANSPFLALRGAAEEPRRASKRRPPTGACPAVPGLEIVKELGSGGVAVVYLARETESGREVAVKLLRSGVNANPKELVRFRREVDTLARLTHPNIVRTYGSGVVDGRPYLIMEYASGGTLADGLRGTPWPPADAAGLIEILARAIHAAHLGGVIHRDLKPSNILFTADGVPKIADFGTAKSLAADGPVATRLGAVLGTPAYMSPEQARGEAVAAGPAADIYALGSILYELVTGKVPFEGRTTADTLFKVITKPPLAPSLINRAVPPAIEAICLRCLSKTPAKRFESAEDLADALAMCSSPPQDLA